MTGCVLGRAACRSCAVVDSYYASRRPATRRAGDSDLTGGLGTAERRDADHQPAGSPDSPQSASPSRSVFPAGSG